MLIGSGSRTTRCVNIRRAIEPFTFPICALFHSLVWEDFFTSYSYLASMMRPFDRLVVPSYSGAKAVTRIFELMDDWTGRKHTLPKPAIIPYGVWPSHFNVIDQASSRRALGVDPDCLLLLYVGRLTDLHKADLEPLLRCVERLGGNGSNIRLLLAGGDDYNYSAHLTHIAVELGIADRIMIWPNFPPALKASLYAASDICVFPSDNIQETFGVAILEAMASARPVIATDWSAYREIIVDGETGVLIPTLRFTGHDTFIPFLLSGAKFPSTESFTAQRTFFDVDSLGKAIGELMENPERRKQMGDAGRMRIMQNYSWQSLMVDFAQLWQEQLWERKHFCRDDPGSHLIENTSGRINFDAFRHYASAELIPGEYSVLITPVGASALQGQPPSSLAALTPAMRDTCRSVLAAVKAAGRHPLEHLLDDHSNRINETVFWLLKHGFLRCDPPVMQNRVAAEGIQAASPSGSPPAVSRSA